MRVQRVGAYIRENRAAFLLLLLGAALLLLGVFRGEVAIVLQNAITICLECVGIG